MARNWWQALPTTVLAFRNRTASGSFAGFIGVEGSIRTAGTGLGLSLVAAVAELHGMKFCATDNMPGLRMTLTFDCGVTEY